MTPVSKPTLAEIAATMKYALEYHPAICVFCFVIFTLVMVCACLPTPGGL